MREKKKSFLSVVTRNGKYRGKYSKRESGDGKGKRGGRVRFPRQHIHTRARETPFKWVMVGGRKHLLWRCLFPLLISFSHCFSRMLHYQTLPPIRGAGQVSSTRGLRYFIVFYHFAFHFLGGGGALWLLYNLRYLYPSCPAGLDTVSPEGFFLYQKTFVRYY